MKFKTRYLELMLLMLIVYSIATHFWEMESGADPAWESFFLWSERIVAIAFTVEYLARWIKSGKWTYPLCPFAIVDLVSILPFYLSFMIDMRSLRLLRSARVFRLFKLYRYTSALKSIQNAFSQVQYEFGVIGFAVLTLAWICSVAVFEFEKDAQPDAFAKLSDAMWYTMTTLTTVGYGDKVPVTLGGRLVAVVMMICGLGLFGTFVSLIGSAFLEELRKNPRRNHKKAGLHQPENWTEIDTTLEHFNPAIVLDSITAGKVNLNDHEHHTKAIQLLTTACQLLKQERHSRLCQIPHSHDSSPHRSEQSSV